MVTFKKYVRKLPQQPPSPDWLTVVYASKMSKTEKMAHNALKLEKYCHVEFLDKYGRDVKDKMLK